MRAGIGKPRRAAGTQTVLDGLTGWMHGSMAERKARDLTAVRSGASRIVKCYLKPDPDEHRLNKVWKPGLLVVSADGAHWKGSRKKWGTIDLPAASCVTRWRPATRDDWPGKRALCNVIECWDKSAHYTFGVPKPDTDLCVAVLSESPDS